MKQKQSRIVAFGASAALALGGLAACGDDDETSTSASALSETELVSQVDAICKEHGDAINSGVEEGFAESGGPTPVAIRTVTKEVILPQYTAQIGQLDALEPPEDLAADYDQWLTDSTAARDAIKDDPNVAFDPAAAEFQTVNDEAQALGFGKDCLVGPTA